MIILGIDPSLNATGWAVVEFNDPTLSLISSGVVTFTPGGDVYDKIASLISHLNHVIATQSISAIAMEETFVNKNAGTSLKLGLVRGACIGLATLVKIAVTEYKPTAVKLAIVGKGGASKEQVAFMVRNILGGVGSFKSNDESDAAAVAITHIVLKNNPLARHRFQ